MKKTILCFGDSNTHGYNSQTDGRFSEEERWTCLLDEMLGTDYRVLEEGLSGRTICFDDPLFEGLNGFTSIFQAMMTHEPLDLLIIMLGTNDVKSRFHATPQNIAKGMERLLKKAFNTTEAWRDQPNILIIAPAPIEPEYRFTFVGGEMGEDCDTKSRALAPLYEDICYRYGCHFLDAGQITGIRMHPKDHMHLDKASHQLLASTLAKKIPALLD